MPVIDYARMQEIHPKQKAALTRAMHLTDANARYLKVRQVCIKTITEWNEIGAWPDDWLRWQRALDDAAIAARVQSVRQEQL